MSHSANKAREIKAVCLTPKPMLLNTTQQNRVGPPSKCPHSSVTFSAEGCSFVLLTLFFPQILKILFLSSASKVTTPFSFSSMSMRYLKVLSMEQIQNETYLFVRIVNVELVKVTHEQKKDKSNALSGITGYFSLKLLYKT